MAELVASPIVGTVIKNLGSPLLNELGLLLNVKKDMEKLKSILSTISVVLEDAERKSIRDDAPVREWLRKLKNAAFDADQVVDEYQYEALRRGIPVEYEYQIEAPRRRIPVCEYQIEAILCFFMQVRDFFSSRNPIVFGYGMARKIQEVTKRLDEIAEEKQKYGLAEGSASASERLLNDRETHSFVIESDVRGRDEDEKKVIGLLIDTDKDKEVSILPIVGLGGVGKTTLAQLVYNNKTIKTHFELRIWVCVSEPFQQSSIIRNAIECIIKDEWKFRSLEVMQEKLRELLSDRKFLLVLDDVWNENEARWEEVKNLFRSGMHGSKILVTTRSKRVATIMGTVPPYPLKELPDDVCWTLFKDRAFGMGREEETPMLMEIGKEIVAKCGGLPLAAKALGSLMASKRGESEWVAVKNSDIWKLPPEETQDILPALRLSYDHLPSKLKQCFVYCSLFPKDYIHDKEKLIKLWIAEGFIPSTDDAEHIGNGYFNVLLWSSFFQDVKKDDYGNIVYCKMHDLVHDLACYVAGKERCTMLAGRQGSSTSSEAGCERDVSVECRYVSLYIKGDDRSVIPNKLYQLNKLRTFLAITSSYQLNLVGLHWGKLSTHLRVLELSDIGIEELPDNLDRLKHLRFLDLSNTRIRTLPASIISLQNLQTLNLSNCLELRRLPQGISFLSRLRHLDLLGTDELSCMPCGMGRLNNLRTLTKFMVGKEGGGSSIVELQHLNLIRGDLQICGLCNVKDANQAGLANLAAKTGLQRLQLRSHDYSREYSGYIDDVDVLENLRPPNNLKELKIYGYAGRRLPSWMTTMESSLPNLVKIDLGDLTRCEHLPPLGHLPSLKYLNIYDVDAVKRIGGEFYGDGGTFPSLQILNLSEMHELEEWSIATESGMESSIYPRLESLEISYCPELKLIASPARRPGRWRRRPRRHGQLRPPPFFTALQRLHIVDCEALTALPEWLGDLTSLQELQIKYCPLLGTRYEIGRGDGQLQPPPFFTALQRLHIQGCKALTVLPEWLVNLTSLQELLIVECPLLETRYKRESGQDWNKIAHIPSLTIL